MIVKDKNGKVLDPVERLKFFNKMEVEMFPDLFELDKAGNSNIKTKKETEPDEYVNPIGPAYTFKLDKAGNTIRRTKEEME